MVLMFMGTMPPEWPNVDKRECSVNVDIWICRRTTTIPSAWPRASGPPASATDPPHPLAEISTPLPSSDSVCLGRNAKRDRARYPCPLRKTVRLPHVLETVRRLVHAEALDDDPPARSISVSAAPAGSLCQPGRRRVLERRRRPRDRPHEKIVFTDAYGADRDRNRITSSPGSSPSRLSRTAAARHRPGRHSSKEACEKYVTMASSKAGEKPSISCRGKCCVQARNLKRRKEEEDVSPIRRMGTIFPALPATEGGGVR